MPLGCTQHRSLCLFALDPAEQLLFEVALCAMQKPTVLSDITVDLAGLGCCLQLEAAVSPCHTSAAKETSLHPLFIEGKTPSLLCREGLD